MGFANITCGEDNYSLSADLQKNYQVHILQLLLSNGSLDHNIVYITIGSSKREVPWLELQWALWSFDHIPFVPLHFSVERPHRDGRPVLVKQKMYLIVTKRIYGAIPLFIILNGTYPTSIMTKNYNCVIGVVKLATYTRHPSSKPLPSWTMPNSSLNV